MAARTYSLIFLICTTVAWGAATAVDSALAKFALIEQDRVPAGGHVTLTASELTAYARVQADVIAPGAVHDPKLTITPGHAEAFAMIDFLHLPQVGPQPGWIVRTLLEGQRPLRVRVRIQSVNGRARVDVEKVEISGVAMEGRTLDFLLSQFVIPSFPEAKTGVWFRLSHGIERLELGNGVVRVVIVGHR
jgi:hypothetical protein